MRNAFLKLYVNSQSLVAALKDEKGQDLVEYAAIIVLIVLATTSGMNSLASTINTAMSNVGTHITSVLT